MPTLSLPTSYIITSAISFGKWLIVCTIHYITARRAGWYNLYDDFINTTITEKHFLVYVSLDQALSQTAVMLYTLVRDSITACEACCLEFLSKKAGCWPCKATLLLSVEPCNNKAVPFAVFTVTGSFHNCKAQTLYDQSLLHFQGQPLDTKSIDTWIRKCFQTGRFISYNIQCLSWHMCSEETAHAQRCYYQAHECESHSTAVQLVYVECVNQVFVPQLTAPQLTQQFHGHQQVRCIVNPFLWVLGSLHPRHLQSVFGSWQADTYSSDVKLNTRVAVYKHEALNVNIYA